MGLLKASIVQFLNIIVYMILVRAVLSWFIKDLNNPVVRFLFEVTEPLLAPFRELQHRIGITGGLDFSPILLFLVIQMLQRAVLMYL